MWLEIRAVDPKLNTATSVFSGATRTLTASAEASETFDFTVGSALTGGLPGIQNAFSLGSTWVWTESRASITGIEREKPDHVNHECGDTGLSSPILYRPVEQ
ncbi:hypothetical protein FQN57_001484 [Myotisia sp. PD_48]|nr:hypothetical protein FQN57_001484 [Myotisia sp. PD_48]